MRRFEKWILRILVFGSILVNIKNIFTSLNVDVEYAIAMSYRMAQGDRMFLQMWEPHQTSAFLAAAFIKLYLLLFSTTTGIVVYMNLVGVCLKGAVTAVLYRSLKKYANQKTLLCICIFFFTINPKNILVPEFSNMQIWFSVLLFCSLLRYMECQEKKGWLLLAGVFLCLEALAYPSGVIVYFGVLLCLLWYARNRWSDILLLTGECIADACLYVSYFVFRMGLGEFLSNLAEIAMGDSSHGKNVFKKLSAYGRDSIQILTAMFLYAVLSYIAVRIYTFLRSRKNSGVQVRAKKEWYITCYLLCYYVSVFIDAIAITTSQDSTSVLRTLQSHLLLYLVWYLLGWKFSKYCDDAQRMAYTIGSVISLCGIASAIVLTNLPLITTLTYGILGVSVSLLSCASAKDVEKTISHSYRSWLLLAYSCIVVLRGGLALSSMTEYKASVFWVSGVVKSGPALGILSTYMGPYIVNTSMEEWKEYIESDDRVLIVGAGTGSTGVVSTLGYLYESTEISIDSTISTPTYNEKLARYWEKNPQKYPNVVVVDCWYGELHIDENSWIMRWLEEDFQADRVIDGKYWRYYLKDN